MLKRLYIYLFIGGLVGALFVLSLYVPASGLINSLEPFVGLRLIVYCTEVYLGFVLLFGAFLFRSRISLIVIYLGAGIFCITNGAEGILAISPSMAQLERSHWLYLSLETFGGIGFLIAVVLSFISARSRKK